MKEWSLRVSRGRKWLTNRLQKMDHSCPRSDFNRLQTRVRSCVSSCSGVGACATKRPRECAAKGSGGIRVQMPGRRSEAGGASPAKTNSGQTARGDGVDTGFQIGDSKICEMNLTFTRSHQPPAAGVVAIVCDAESGRRADRASGTLPNL